MIKQMIQIPENLSPVLLVTQEDGTALWEDAAKCGIPVFMALTDEDEAFPYTIDGTGVGVLGGLVAFRPSVHCPKCGQKMWIAPHRNLEEQLTYQCSCGITRRVQVR